MPYEPSIFRAYDVRGLYPSQMNEDVAYALGQAFVAVMQAKNVVVGQDVRASGKSLKSALIKGVTDAGANVIDVGVISTEMLYFASGALDCDGGLTVTASHNPAEWNGTKLIGKNGTPLTKEAELGQIYEYVQSGKSAKAETPGTVTERDILADYVEHVIAYKPDITKPLKAVANANFGANGKVVDAVASHMPMLALVRMNWNEDGTFPKGTPDPLLPKNRAEIAERIVAEGADFGVAWDADADRAFFLDEKGRFFNSYYINALLIEYFAKRNPASNFVVDPRMTWAIDDAVKHGGGARFMSKAGHGYIKQALRKHDAIFAGENSGHFYYRDFYSCDNGIISFLIVTGLFAESIAAGTPVSAMLDRYMEKYPVSGEMNFVTERGAEIVEAAKERFADAEITAVDGTSIEYPAYRFNLRLSGNEPIMRLNLEARDKAALDANLAEVVAWIESFGAVLRDDNA